MWEILKSTSDTSQYSDRQLSAEEKAQDKVFVTQKTVRTLGFWLLYGSWTIFYFIYNILFITRCL